MGDDQGTLDELNPEAARSTHSDESRRGGSGASEVPANISVALNQVFPQGCPSCKCPLGQIKWSAIKKAFTSRCSGAKKHAFDYHDSQWMAERQRQQSLRLNKKSPDSDDEPLAKLRRL